MDNTRILADLPILTLESETLKAYLLDFKVCSEVFKSPEGFWIKKFPNFVLRERRRTSRTIKANQSSSMMRGRLDGHGTSYFRFLSRSIWKHKPSKNDVE